MGIGSGLFFLVNITEVMTQLQFSHLKCTSITTSILEPFTTPQAKASTLQQALFTPPAPKGDGARALVCPQVMWSVKQRSQEVGEKEGSTLSLTPNRDVSVAKAQKPKLGDEAGGRQPLALSFASVLGRNGDQGHRRLGSGSVCPRHGQPPSSGFRAPAQCFSFLLANPQSVSLPRLPWGKVYCKKRLTPAALLTRSRSSGTPCTPRPGSPTLFTPAS